MTARHPEALPDWWYERKNSLPEPEDDWESLDDGWQYAYWDWDYWSDRLRRSHTQRPYSRVH